MATKHKKQDIFDFNKLSPEEGNSNIEAYRAKRVESFEENNKIIHDSLHEFYWQQQDIFQKSTEDEKIMQISRLHAMAEVSGWLIGDFLLTIEERLKETGSQYPTLSEWFRAHAELLPFSRAAMYNYVNIRKGVSFQHFIDFGVKAALEVAKIKDVDLRQKVIKTASEKIEKEPSVRVDVIKDVIEQELHREHEKEKKRKEKKKERQKTQRAEVHISVTKRGKSIVITPEESEFDLVLDAIHANINRIKDYVLLNKE